MHVTWFCPFHPTTGAGHLCSNDPLHAKFPIWKMQKLSAMSQPHSEAGRAHGITVYYVKGQVQVLLNMLCSVQSASKIHLESFLFSASPPACFSVHNFFSGLCTNLSLTVSFVLFVFTSYFYPLIILNFGGLIFYEFKNIYFKTFSYSSLYSSSFK